MEVADEIVVINDGRIEQVGTPDSLYDRPANDFVMGFLGEVTRLGDLRLRPHDIEISRTPDLAGSSAADILRLTRVGFEVRLVAGTEDGQEVSVVTTRAHARSLSLDEGERVWLTPSSGAATVPAMTPVVQAELAG
jgi:sulfate transport system ATP-binding protein